MPRRLSAADELAVRFLRDGYQSGASEVDVEGLAARLGSDERDVEALLNRLCSLQVVAYDDPPGTGRAALMTEGRWRILPRIVDLAADIETPPDRVAEFIADRRQNEKTFRWVLLLMGAAFVLGLLNQFFELLEHVSGWL